MKTLSLLILFLLCLGMQLKAQNYNSKNYSLEEVVLSEEEQKLYDLIMEYRKSQKLPMIPISRSLTYVAQVHCWDLYTNQPTSDNCNMHSWSSAGDWSSCCYTSDHKQAKCMWDKPRELTNYKATGFEIAFGTSGYKVTAQGALEGWQSSSGHNAVIINEGTWKKYNWQAIGIGIYGGYAMVWFGASPDAATPPKK